MPEEKRGTKVIHPRLPDELYSELKEYAAAEHRTVNNAAVVLIKQGLADATDEQTDGETDE
jgi:hypothetical protein